MAHGGGTQMGRNTNVPAQVGSTIGTRKVVNPVVGKQGGKSKLGNSSGSMVKLSRARRTGR